MLKFLKSFFGSKPAQPVAEAPYKIEAPEPAKCGCGRSQSGLCVGLHKLSPEDWAVHQDNPSKPVAKAKKAPAKKAPAKPKAEKKPAAIKAPKKVKKEAK